MQINFDKNEISSILDALAIASQTAAGNMTEEYVKTYKDQILDWQNLYKYLTEETNNE